MKKRNPGAKHTFIDLTLIKVYTWAIIITHQIIHPSMVSLGPIADLYSALSKSMTTTPWHDTKIRWDERAQTLTSSTQQQVWSGLGTGSGLSGLQLKLSPEPRVEQGHAQEVKPAPQRKWEREREEERKKAHHFNVGMIYNVAQRWKANLFPYLFPDPLTCFHRAAHTGITNTTHRCQASLWLGTCWWYTG